MKVKVRITKPYKSNALRRIHEAVNNNLPYGWSVDSNPDVTIVPVVSINDTQNLPENYIIWQLCYITAGGDRESWLNIWDKAQMVVSYLDLNYDRQVFLPLGYDPRLFYNQDKERPYKAITTGYIDGQMGEEIISVWKHLKPMAHVGKNFNLGNGYTHYESIDDLQIAALYNQSKYVAAMRHFEGFELPALEGLACGCVPIMLDVPCYRKWFDGYAMFLDPNNVEYGLELLSKTPEDIEKTTKKMIFTWDENHPVNWTWEHIMRKFWEAYASDD